MNLDHITSQTSAQSNYPSGYQAEPACFSLWHHITQVPIIYIKHLFTWNVSSSVY